jgi:adenosylmethionine-8-amino-7-oxononanoate aminotransferase
MSDLVILGTDTDAGKTTFALLWLAAFADDYEYWKPIESGTSDTERVHQLVPRAAVHEPIQRFQEAVAPSLAARGEGVEIPAAAVLAQRRPRPSHSGRPLLIETFGGPFSPLNEGELQIPLLHALAASFVLVSSSAVGAVGRTLQALQALEAHAIRPHAVVLVGQADSFAETEIVKHRPTLRVFSLQPPRVWSVEGLQAAAREQASTLAALRLAYPISLPPCGGGLEWGVKHLGPPLHPSPTRGEGANSDANADFLARDRQAIWHPYTSLREPDAPRIVVAAQDEFLWLADGRRVIDGISSWWTILHGHRHPPLVAVLQQALASLDHVHFAGVTHRPAVELAELLLATAPWSGGRVFFSDNGSTAVEVALKMAYQFWCHRGQAQRTWFVGFEGGYHGDTFGAMAAGRDPLFFGRFEPLLFRAEIVPVSAERLEEFLERHHDEVAAVILEPLVQGAGGMRMHTPEELRQIVGVAHRHDVLFIADEAMTCGRLGTLWAHQEAGVAPDLICAAKTLAGGMLSVAATLAAPHVVGAWDTDDRSRTFFHGHSFTAHPLACAVAVVSWKLLTSASGTAQRQMEAFWKEALAPLRSDSRVRDVRIRGTLAAVEINVPGGYLADVGRRLRHACLQRDVLLRPLGSVLYALPPLCTSEASLGQIAEAMIGAVEALPTRAPVSQS